MKIITNIQDFIVEKTLSDIMYPGIKLNYSNLFRLILFSWLDNYNGNDENFNLVKYEPKKDSSVTEYFNKIPTNNVVMKRVVKTIGGKVDNKSIDKKQLYNLIDKKDELFTEEKIKEWFNITKYLTERSKTAEIVTGMILQENGVYDYFKLPTPEQDKKGVDLFVYKNEQEITTQVKYPFNSTIEMEWGTFLGKSEYTIFINNTNIDLKPYKKGNTLPYELLFICDKINKKLYQIDVSIINSIVHRYKNNTKIINLGVENEKELSINMKTYVLDEKHIKILENAKKN